MYWNIQQIGILAELETINYNMRCIETQVNFYIFLQSEDKLQHEMYWNKI